LDSGQAMVVVDDEGKLLTGAPGLRGEEAPVGRGHRIVGDARCRRRRADQARNPAGSPCWHRCCQRVRWRHGRSRETRVTRQAAATLGSRRAVVARRPTRLRCSAVFSVCRLACEPERLRPACAARQGSEAIGASSRPWGHPRQCSRAQTHVSLAAAAKECDLRSGNRTLESFMNVMGSHAPFVRPHASGHRLALALSTLKETSSHKASFNLTFTGVEGSTLARPAGRDLHRRRDPLAGPRARPRAMRLETAYDACART
jgi:hypothetical protein